jgi:hypothetical protein
VCIEVGLDFARAVAPRIFRRTDMRACDFI